MRRRLTRREKNKRSKQIIMISTICLLCLITVGYAAFNTSLSLKAKGNIVERITSEKIKNEFCNTESGDGLYKDIYEDEKCFYKGTNPNNYIIFNNEEWRIISIENDGALKIMRNELLNEMMYYGISYGYDWAGPSSLNEYLNGEYLNSITTNSNKILTYDWKIGAVGDSSNLSNIINLESKTIWSGKIGIITVSEYLRANSNTNECETENLNDDNNTICINTNWMYKNQKYWTITYADSPPALIMYIDSDGKIKNEPSYMGKKGVIPCLYLSSDITLSGSGTQQDPYIITN